MKCIAELLDTQYEKTETTHTRAIARAVLINSQKKVCLMHLLCDDSFGHRDYYETPGGGIEEGETPQQAVIREIKEETGFDSEIIEEIGYVSDYYNLIHRHNMNYYFLVKTRGNKEEQNWTEQEKTLFSEVGWYSFNEALRLYERMDKEPLEKLVRNRELPVLKLALEIIKRRGKQNE